jgi:hypothetical protein
VYIGAGSLKKLIGNFQLLIVSSVFGIIITLFTAQVFAQSTREPRLKSNVGNQIQVLQQEKASRTPIQQKIDSQLLYALQKTHKTGSSTELRPTVKIDSSGNVLVDIDAKVTDSLLGNIKHVGGKILNSFPRDHTVRAKLPLAQVEFIAGLPEVKFIQPAVEATTRKGSSAR